MNNDSARLMNRHSLDLMGGSGQPEAMLPGDLPAVYSGLRAKALLPAVTQAAPAKNNYIIFQ